MCACVCGGGFSPFTGAAGVEVADLHEFSVQMVF